MLSRFPNFCTCEKNVKNRMGMLTGPVNCQPAGPATRQPQNFPTALTSAGPHSGAPRLVSPADNLSPVNTTK